MNLDTLSSMLLGVFERANLWKLRMKPTRSDGALFGSKIMRRMTVCYRCLRCSAAALHAQRAATSTASRNEPAFAPHCKRAGTAAVIFSYESAI